MPPKRTCKKKSSENSKFSLPVCPVCKLIHPENSTCPSNSQQTDDVKSKSKSFVASEQGDTTIITRSTVQTDAKSVPNRKKVTKNNKSTRKDTPASPCKELDWDDLLLRKIASGKKKINTPPRPDDESISDEKKNTRGKEDTFTVEYSDDDNNTPSQKADEKKKVHETVISSSSDEEFPTKPTSYTKKLVMKPYSRPSTNIVWPTPAMERYTYAAPPLPMPYGYGYPHAGMPYVFPPQHQPYQPHWTPLPSPTFTQRSESDGGSDRNVKTESQEDNDEEKFGRLNTVDEALVFYEEVCSIVKRTGCSRNRALAKLGRHLNSFKRIERLCVLAKTDANAFEEVKSRWMVDGGASLKVLSQRCAVHIKKNKEEAARKRGDIL